MPTQARSGVKRHETKGLTAGRFDHFPNIDPHLLVYELQLIHETNIDGAKHILRYLDDFRSAGTENQIELQ